MILAAQENEHALPVSGGRAPTQQRVKRIRATLRYDGVVRREGGHRGR